MGGAGERAGGWVRKVSCTWQPSRLRPRWPAGQGAWEQGHQRCVARLGGGGSAAQALPTLGAGLWPRWPHHPALRDGEPVWLPAHIPVPWESQAHPTSAESPGASDLTASSGRGQPWCPPSKGRFLWDFWASSRHLATHSRPTCVGWGAVHECVHVSPCEASYTAVDSQGQAVAGPSAAEDPLFCPETSGSEGDP